MRVVAKDSAGNTSWSNQLKAKTVVTAPVATSIPVIAPKTTQSVSSTGITYSGSTAPAAGTILVGQQGQGYLRKVTSATESGGTVTARTKSASLNELFSDISFASNVKLVSTRVQTDTSSAAQTMQATGLRLMRTNLATRQLHWKSGLTLRGEQPPNSTAVQAAGISILSAVQLASQSKTGSVSGAMQTTQQAQASFTAPAVFAGEPGEQFSFDLTVQPKSGYELCTIEQTRFDSGTSTKPALGNLNKQTGIATVTWSPTDNDVRDTPYYAEFTAYVDAIGDNCKEGPIRQWLSKVFGGSAKLKLKVPIFVVKGTSAEVNNQEKSVTFQGGFTVTDKITMDFNPEFNVAAHISYGRLKTAHLTVKTDIDFKNKINISAAGGATLGKTVPILTVPILNERSFTKIYMVGSVPVIVSGKFKIEGRITGQAFGKVDLDQTIDLHFPDAEFGLQYDQNGWHAVKNFKTDYSFSLKGQGTAGAEIKLHLIPDMQISFYDAASGRLIVDPYLYANTAIQGHAYMNSTSGAGGNSDYWFKKLVAGAGVDLRLWAGLSILDFNIASYPGGVTINQTDQFKRFSPIAETPIWGLPTLVATLSTPSGLKDSRTLLIQGTATNVPNPFAAYFGKPSLNPFLGWDQPKVLKQINGIYVATTAASIKAAQTVGQYEFHYTQLGNYEVRLAGHSDAGSFFRQVASTTIAITDNNHNGMADQWETRWGVSDPNADPDGDGMTNLQEYQRGYFPKIADNPNPSAGGGTTGGGSTGGGSGTGGTPGGNPGKNLHLNDTGITWGGNYPAGNNATCIGETVAQQDCSQGRDAQAAAGALTKIGAGDAGFDFTKLDSSGAPLANQTRPYTTTPWDCVKDNLTGLEWEVKQPAGSGGLRDANNSYTWYNATGVNDGGNPGTANGGSCTDSGHCDTEKYVAAVNSAGLCGRHDWRMPTMDELIGIVDYGKSNPAIDTGYFPNTPQNSSAWSSSPDASGSGGAWVVGPSDGNRDGYYHQVWLVRSGQ